MKKLIILLVVVLSLSSCKRWWNTVDRSIQITDKYYEINVYSGGKIIFTDKFKGIVNNSANSDGVYYYNSKNELVEISGDYIITSY